MPARVVTETVTTHRGECDECDQWFASTYLNRTPATYDEYRERTGALEREAPLLVVAEEAARHDARWHA